jgi:glycosylphosphatidylinositol transamidase (GPIT) subunit GPI8
VRSRITCNVGVPVYAKVEIIGLEDNSIILKVLANENCGYRGLLPGLPDR